jgi:hypothetical protein
VPGGCAHNVPRASLQSGGDVHPSRSSFIALAFLISLGLCTGTAHAAPGLRCEAAAAVTTTDQQALRTGAASEVANLYANPSHARALAEMLLGGHASALRWDRVPELVVLMPVMTYEKGSGTNYRATAEQLTDAEATALVADLTEALAVLTDDALRAFSSVRRETVSPGDIVNVMRPGQIVVGRYKGVREQLATIGFGGRATRGDTIRSGSIILDSDFDRSSSERPLLRMHELGHALGYNHVESQVSIMNPRIGPAFTDFDRAATRLAFQNFSVLPGSCS